MEELVQCEYCDTYIYSDDYDEHLEICSENITYSTLLMESVSLQSSLTSSINSTIFNTLYVSDNNNNINENYEEDDENEDGEYDDINLNDTMRPSRNLNFNIYEPNLNLQDVYNPVKNIDLVAPIVSYDTLPSSDFYCTICQDKISNNLRKTLCNHYYCCDCIEPWLKELNKKCPICSANLEDLLIKLQIADEDEEEDEEYEEIKKEDIE